MISLLSIVSTQVTVWPIFILEFTVKMRYRIQNMDVIRKHVVAVANDMQIIAIKINNVQYNIQRGFSHLRHFYVGRRNRLSSTVVIVCSQCSVKVCHLP